MEEVLNFPPLTFSQIKPYFVKKEEVTGLDPSRPKYNTIIRTHGIADDEFGSSTRFSQTTLSLTRRYDSPSHYPITPFVSAPAYCHPLFHTKEIKSGFCICYFNPN